MSEHNLDDYTIGRLAQALSARPAATNETGKPPMTEPLPSRSVQRYGWRPDLPDHRDLTFAVEADVAHDLPPFVDMREHCPSIYDQGALGSCTANAIAAAYEYDLTAQNESPVWRPSRLFIYYNERVIEDSVAYDSGAMIRDGMKTVAKQGVCHEDEWPYDVEKFADRPPQHCYADAKHARSRSYRRVRQNLAAMKSCLAADLPFVFGFSVFESFESAEVASTGSVPMPESGEAMVGGHAVLAVGYLDSSQEFVVRNSWGPGWGDGGYCYMPYAYLLDADYASDFWVMSRVA